MPVSPEACLSAEVRLKPFGPKACLSAVVRRVAGVWRTAELAQSLIGAGA